MQQARFKILNVVSTLEYTQRDAFRSEECYQRFLGSLKMIPAEVGTPLLSESEKDPPSVLLPVLEEHEDSPIERVCRFSLIKLRRWPKLYKP